MVTQIHQPFILAVSGGSGSGKTSLATRLAQALSSLQTCIISEDHYYHDNGATPGFDAAVFNFDAPATRDHRLLSAHLAALRSGRPINMPSYDFHLHRRMAETSTVAPAEIIIVEGTLVLHDAALRAQYDYSVYLDLPDDIRLIRRLRRDVAERGRDLESVLRQYEATVRPMHFDYIAPCRAYANRVAGIGDPGVVENIAMTIEAWRRDQGSIVG